MLTLPEASQRQARVACWLNRARITTDVFVPGVDLRRPGVAFDAPVQGRLHRLRRYGCEELTAPEYGCLLGHRRIWQRLLDSQAPWALVLEDDATPFRDDWWPAVQQLATSLVASRFGDQAWVVHLSRTLHSQRTMALRPVRWREDAAVPPLGAVDLRLGDVWTTLAYLVSRAAALACLEREAALPWLADDWSQRLRQRTLDLLLAADPPLFMGFDDFPSQIQQRTGAVHGPQAQRFQRKLLTLAYRSGLGSLCL